MVFENMLLAGGLTTNFVHIYFNKKLVSYFRTFTNHCQCNRMEGRHVVLDMQRQKSWQRGMLLLMHAIS